MNDDSYSVLLQFLRVYRKMFHYPKEPFDPARMEELADTEYFQSLEDLRVSMAMPLELLDWQEEDLLWLVQRDMVVYWVNPKDQQVHIEVESLLQLLEHVATMELRQAVYEPALQALLHPKN